MSKTRQLVNIIHNNGKPVRFYKTPSRNDVCPCGSGKKFKHCHISNWQEFVRAEIQKLNELNK